MPFRPSSLCFQIPIASHPKGLEFGVSSAYVAHSVECRDPMREEFKVVAAQRTRTGERIDNRWTLRENPDASRLEDVLKKSLPGVQFLELEFNGTGLAAALEKRESEQKDDLQLNLYRTILAKDQIRLEVKVGKRTEYLVLDLDYAVLEANNKCR